MILNFFDKILICSNVNRKISDKYYRVIVTRDLVSDRW